MQMASSKIFVLWAQVLKFLIAGHTCPSFMKHIYFNGLFFWVIPLGFHGGSEGENKTKQKQTRLPMQETQVRSLGWEDTLEKEMATHSSIPAWKIPWTTETGGLQSIGSQSQI